MSVKKVSGNRSEANYSHHNSTVLPSQHIREYVKQNIVVAEREIQESQIQPASLDLRLGSVAYQLRTSFLPGGYNSILDKLQELRLNIRKLDLREPVTLIPGEVYLVELQEKLDLPKDVLARANPRSTTGRADLFTRLLCDYSTSFEGVPLGYSGSLYAEIVPRTFSVRVQEGTRVNQIRFIQTYGHNVADIHLHFMDYEITDKHNGVLTVDLSPNDFSGTIGYRAKRYAPTLDFDCVKCHDRFDFWEPLYLTELRSIVLRPDDLYILRSRERINVPPNFASELLPYDSSFGEFRVHYAGFLDPGFGHRENGAQGTPVVLEVRARDVPFLIEHGQNMARIVYYELNEAADKLYGRAIGSSYQEQDIALGKQFR